jgi:hypothetical protein
MALGLRGSLTIQRRTPAPLLHDLFLETGPTALEGKSISNESFPHLQPPPSLPIMKSQTERTLSDDKVQRLKPLFSLLPPSWLNRSLSKTFSSGSSVIRLRTQSRFVASSPLLFIHSWTGAGFVKQQAQIPYTSSSLSSFRSYPSTSLTRFSLTLDEFSANR